MKLLGWLGGEGRGMCGGLQVSSSAKGWRGDEGQANCDDRSRWGDVTYSRGTSSGRRAHSLAVATVVWVWCGVVWVDRSCACARTSTPRSALLTQALGAHEGRLEGLVADKRGLAPVPVEGHEDGHIGGGLVCVCVCDGRGLGLGVSIGSVSRWIVQVSQSASSGIHGELSRSTTQASKQAPSIHSNKACARALTRVVRTRGLEGLGLGEVRRAAHQALHLRLAGARVAVYSVRV